ncbi:ATP-binding cassette domain-containing protein [Tetragenococcus halophilus]|uniref:Putative ABC transporter ATP-binding/permease protein n=1 Tax=Tetragenococcus halophilus subsp. halophilus TaxID=1513897 RepID=A0A2H6CQT3_TETHA|nr:ABC transporter ATP-binding protein/permease [Tetragenococcus halophilus]AOF48185.1 sulfate ABC transporter ATP-binding protein [Tetragenococcus halophilus]MCF1600729.1 ATP-binding cassette domain-containing protein [Tetragenococcus halophilus]MCO8285071.1 ATP-binding cassette domain-containing protein [Tetragenococcus halophilus]MCO8286554.1 ATP-binding cassette domain-containing protein [Tetragenococcus halophilus]MDN6256661.1 ATP-binding cassette domain-containing protein [Tetragenococcu
MLELRDIKKQYKVGNTVTKALDGVSVAFRQQEFVAILGESGSGKTTLLNVIGGLDQYDSGDMVINGKSTKDFKDKDWDAYRNNSIGFIFQSYNLIGHQGIIDNVELGMTLSGVSKKERRKKAEEALERVGLTEHMHKKPSQLSGGQMQRVAIARALANDPDILLCDEPTGALDSQTSVQIMNLIQEVAKDKLVVMVTHNADLANKYADRTISFADGQVTDDSNPHVEGKKKEPFDLKHTKMTFLTALRLSFNNIRTKKGRTFLTAFASSIGIISIAIVLSLSTGFQKQIDQTQSETLAQFPVTISRETTEQDPENFEQERSDEGTFPEDKEVTAKISEEDRSQRTNKIDQDFIDYVDDINPALSNNIGYTRLANMNLLREVDDEPEVVKFSNGAEDESQAESMMSMMAAQTGIGVSSFPKQLDDSQGNFLEDNYRLLEGNFPEDTNEVVLVVDENNETNINALNNLGFDLEDGDKISFDDVIGTTVKLAYNDAFYEELPTGNFIPNQDLDEVYDNEDNEELTISGVIRNKESSTMDLLAPGIAYSDTLAQKVIDNNKDSDIVQAQEDSDTNVMTNEDIDDTAKDNLLDALGASEIPYSVMIYPNNFDDKEQILDYLDDYNEGKDEDDQIVYSDLAGTMTDLTGGIMDAITYVLIAFAGISLITSMIMIGIITYTSVLERTKEIGVLKALGARKKDVTRVFDAETAILGVASGTLGVVLAYLATFPINSVLLNLTDLENVAQLDPMHALILVIVSTVLTMIGGHIPARMAAKKDAAIALRAE